MGSVRAEAPSLAPPAPSLILPRWFKSWRKGQYEAVEEIVRHFASGARYVFLQAPVGAGKTLIADAVRQMLFMPPAPHPDPECCYDSTHGWRSDEGCCSQMVDQEMEVERKHTRTVYTCSTLDLQQQFVRDFPESRLIMGRANYRTEFHPERFPKLSCADCTRTRSTPCDWCSDAKSCPYMNHKRAALVHHLVVANMAYMSTEPNFSGGFSGLDFLITDEADVLEKTLMGNVEIYLSDRRQRELGIVPPEYKTKPDSWQVWLETEAIPKVQIALDLLPRNAPDITTVRKRRGLAELLDRLQGVDLRAGWVYDGPRRGGDPSSIRFRPIKVDRFAPSLYFRHAARHLLMSATIISADQMATDLGIRDEKWALVEVPSTFPPERSPIVIRPIADMSRAKNERVKLLVGLRRILAQHPDDRILVHTVSYDLTRWLKEYLTSPRVLAYDSARGREQALTTFRKTSAAVLLAPSLDRGIDLPDDAARVIVLVKCPFPSLGDKVVDKRLRSFGGDSWYAFETLRRICQGMGRAMRHEQDWCRCYILDSQFTENIWRRYRYFFPRWFRDRIDWHERIKVIL